MKVLVNFFVVLFSVVFFVGCGGGGSSDVKCTNPNPTFPSLQSVFPASLFGEPYWYEGKVFGYNAISNRADYIQALINKGYGLDQDELDYVTYTLNNPFPDTDIQFADITIWSDNYVDWHLGGSESGISDLLFEDTDIFPPTGTKQDGYGLDRLYASSMASEFDEYVRELEADGFRYDSDDFEGWIKYSEDKCFIYLWYSGDNSADWEIVLNVEH
jgi:hypothetical protein